MSRATATVLGFALFVVAGAAAQTQPEFRAAWGSRFEWPDLTPSVSQGKIITGLTNLATGHFNAVLLQVRGQADVFYPSPYEPWSPLIGGADPGWDPLAFALDQAHSRGIQLHAYINTQPCWQSTVHAEPNNPNHLFYSHCDASNAGARDWLIHNASGAPVQWAEDNYVWMAPGVPACQAYIRKQVLYVVRNYDVDGVHFDRIRTPNSTYSYDPISMARFTSAGTNPDNLSFHAWTADQLTRMVRDIYAEIALHKPLTVAVSAAVFPDSSTAPVSQHQDGLAWARAGALDWIIPMMYSAGGAGTTWDTRLQAWVAGAAGRHVVAGHSAGEGYAALVEQVELTRLRGAQGNSAWNWTGFTWWEDYASGVYATPVSVPAMPWKAQTAIVCGWVTDATGAPVVDAQVQLSGQTYTALTSGDGFYSFLLVPAGTYMITLTHPDYMMHVVPNQVVTASSVLRVDVPFGAPQAPVIAAVTPNPDTATVGQEYRRQLTLTRGPANAWTLVAGPAGAGLGGGGYLSGWTPTAEQVGQTVTFTVRATNGAGFDEETWSVQVPVPPACTRVKLTDFDNYTVGNAALFQLPRYSGSTVNHLAATPNVAQVTDTVTAFSGAKCEMVQWAFVDASTQHWLRLTTHNGAQLPNPTVALDRPLRVRLRLDSGQVRVCVGIRETGTTADIGADGGTSGTIEWVGATGVVGTAPQGRLITAQPGVWQTLLFDPRQDPITPQTGDGVLASSTGKGVFEQLAFSAVDSAGPFTAYIDDIELLCAVPAYGDLNHDGDVDAQDLTLFAGCFAGPQVTVSGTCTAADGDSDVDVDLADFARLQRMVGVQ